MSNDKPHRNKRKAEACNSVVFDARLHHGAVRLWLCLYHYTDWKSGKCFPAVNTIRDKIGCTLNSITTWTGSLVDHNWLAVGPWKNGQTRQYYVLGVDGQPLCETVTVNSGEPLREPITVEGETVTEKNKKRYGKKQKALRETSETVTETHNRSYSLSNLSNQDSIQGNESEDCSGDGKEDGGALEDVAKAIAGQKRNLNFVPPTLDYLQTWLDDKVFVGASAYATSFLNAMEASGWKAKDGQPVQSWQSVAKKWANTCEKNKRRVGSVDRSIGTTNADVVDDYPGLHDAV